MADRAQASSASVRRMAAVVALRAGGPDVLHVTRDLEIPEPRKDEVRIAVAAASVNPIDVRRRAGYGRRLFSLMGASKFPLVLGNDFAGVVDSVGVGVSGWSPGQRVYGCKAASRRGTHAEFAIVPADQLLATPAGVRDEDAASLPYSFVTAYRLLADGLKSGSDQLRGKSLLVHGGAGAVGSIAARILRRWEAEVTISGRHADRQCADMLGARSTLDLQATGPGDDAGGFDAIVNCASFDDEARLVPLLRPGAIGLASVVHPLISTLDAQGWLRGAMQARRIWRERAAAVRTTGAQAYRWVMFRPSRAALEELERMMSDGLLPADVCAVYPLEQAALAHARVEQGGARGKTMLAMPT